jgi:hypothetical protein
VSDVVVTKQRVKPEKVDRLRAWMDEIRNREAEAAETHDHEGMLSEAAFLERTDDGVFLVYVMEAEDFEEAVAAFRDSPYDIDEEHKAVMDEVLESWENVGEYELLYSMTSSKNR